MADPRMHVPRVTTLGRTAVSVGGRPVELTPAERMIVGALVVRARSGVEVAILRDVLWPVDPPPNARQSISNHMSHLRRKLPGAEVDFTDGRYRFVHPPSTDIDELTTCIEHARAAMDNGDLEHAIALLPAATAPVPRHLEDIAGHRIARAIALAADEQLLQAHELRVTALVAAGIAEQAITELELLVDSHPEREHLWVRLIAAMIDTGRRLDAIGAYRRGHRALSEWGLEPGRRLRQLHDALFLPDGRLQTSRSTVFVGRGRELTTCRTALRDGGRLLVTGGADSGKTALLTHVAATWGAAAVVLQCGENRWSALSPLVDLAEGLLSPVDAAALSACGDPADGVLDSTLRRLSGAIAARPGLLVVLDDWDRVAPFSALVLTHLLRGTGTAVLASSRGLVSTPLGAGQPTLLELAPLSRADVTEWLSPETGGAADLIMGLTGGLPGRIRAVLSEAHAAGWRPTDLADRADGRPLSPGLRKAVLATAEGLPAAAQTALEVLAVLGDGMLVSRIAELTDVSELGSAVDLGLVRCRDGLLSFANGLLRRVLAEQTPPGRRQEWQHLAWATGDTTTTDPLVVASATHVGQVDRRRLQIAS